MARSSPHNDLLSSIISDIKSYSGKDPLLPWLRGVKRMKESLPPRVTEEKLPRFLQKCAQEFESDRRYKNDLRYIRVWLHLMDYVEDPRQLLRSMEKNGIGTKRSLYYQANALYYEKHKKFEEAEKMYHLGVQNLAEPIEELNKSYEQFLQRMQRHKCKKIQLQQGRSSKRPPPIRNSDVNKENASRQEVRSKGIINGNSRDHIGVAEDSKEPLVHKSGLKVMTKQQSSDEPSKLYRDDSVVVKFVDTTVEGNAEAEDACHHGLLDPTINMKEAMNAINSMFREPLEIARAGRSRKCAPKEEHGLNKMINVLVDDDLDEGITTAKEKQEMRSLSEAQSYQQPFHIFVDGDESGENADRINEYDNSEQNDVENLRDGSKAFVFPCPEDESQESSDDMDANRSPHVKLLREDTVVHRFVGSTILDELHAENVCHHGLVDPTINLKEAMDDINNMFGKPIEFARARRRRLEKEPAKKQDVGGFSILPDDDLDDHRCQPRPTALFEPTVSTKEAMDDINKMFAVPLDF